MGIMVTIFLIMGAGFKSSTEAPRLSNNIPYQDPSYGPLTEPLWSLIVGI